jgi:RNA polymerase sigma-70 factor (ECF subfamily)
VNSALQRARATLQSVPTADYSGPLDETDEDLMRRYVEAFENYDMAALVKLLHEDAIQSMPPWPLWLRGAEDICTWMVQPAPSACRGSRLFRVSANGCPAFAQYKPDPAGGYQPWAIQVLEVTEGKIVSMNFFLSLIDPKRLFPYFGLPDHLDG